MKAMKVKAEDKRQVLVTDNVATDEITAQRLDEITSRKRATWESDNYKWCRSLQNSRAAAKKLRAARKAAEQACVAWRKSHAQWTAAESHAQDYGSLVDWAYECYKQALIAEQAACTLVNAAV